MTCLIQLSFYLPDETIRSTLLLAKGADADEWMSTQRIDGNPSEATASGVHEPLVRQLLENGIDANTQDDKRGMVLPWDSYDIVLKNVLIGHKQKQEMWIGLDIVSTIVQLLSHLNVSKKQQQHQETSDASIHGQTIRNKSGEEAKEGARLQATIILGNLAYGRLTYIAQLLAAPPALPLLLARLLIEEASPQIVLATFYALITIADTLASAHPASGLPIVTLSDLLLLEPQVELMQILPQHSPLLATQQQMPLATALMVEVNEARVIHPPEGILAAVCFIIVHIAASKPQHQQLLILQTELLKLLASLAHHPNKNVRVAVAWSVINLTQVDDEADQASCRKGAAELRRLGFLGKLEDIEQDPELDVRERCKTALYQMKTPISFGLDMA
ncbi:hypothetical protein FGG08_003198 [Glutinoglossum americanum]|uniref:Uncharacterized protein n=1 Tax=Glutinoglossum americanum TaxID=1670608 RepID=A0A9P8IDT7_9PEZI|nr:hypothetical protein FGG08_003198 [Glutinoglossum americanum]